ncbi:MAG: tetratricopeptide repeat protein, partial [Anaerolineales bacterium]
LWAGACSRSGRIADPSQAAAQAGAIENLAIAVQKDETYLETAKTEVDFRDLSKTDGFIDLIFQGPQNAMIWYGGEGDRQRDAENFDAAQDAYQLALELAGRAGDNSDKANYQNRLGQLFWQENNIEKATEHFEEAITLEPTNAKYHFDVGNFYASQESWHRALVRYNAALNINPEYVAALVGRGKVLIRQEEPDHEAAEESFSTAIRLEPNNSEAYYGRAMARAYLGQAREASTDLRKAIALNTDLISRAKTELAFEDIQAAISPLLSAAENFRDGNQLAAEGRYDEAIPKYLGALELDPSSLVYRARLGDMYYQLGRLGDAEKHYLIVVSGAPDNDNYQYLLGRIYEDQGQLDPAIEKYKRAISINDGNAQYYARLAAVYDRQEDLNNALAAYDRAIELDKNNPSYVYSRALVYKDSGDLERAIQDFEAAIQANPDYGDAYCELGLAYQEMDQDQQASDNLTQCLQLSEREELRAKATQALGVLGLP